MIDIRKVVEKSNLSNIMNKKWAVKRLTINLTSGEAEKLEKYCSSTGRPATDVIRELIRTLTTEGEE
ncbi:Ribbon-helix-helix [Nostoc sphaeroides CCNUC1]|uniref:Ribbon-helix-helix n=2 Tax=Nostoc sphaeroides TaxID=446679 RepID=A0A5P8VW28_9NOSO|nr:Ribbon-helix-helix [Nostoc sphaeroides CCNUC1]